MPQRLLTLLAGLLSLSLPAFAHPIITEFMAKNESTLVDENGDYSDWIEIHNPDATAVNLEGWTLTDKANQPAQWAFPAVTLQPGEYLIVFASGKNRSVAGQELHTSFSLSTSGEYLGLLAPNGDVGTEFSPAFPAQYPDLSYGTSTPRTKVKLLGVGDPAQVHVPASAALGNSWRAPSFNASSWTSGTLGVGFDRSTSPVDLTPYIGTNVESQMYNQRTSVYIRSSFEITNPAQVYGLELRTRYDDGYAIFLNGSNTPVDQVNAPASLAWDSSATQIVYDNDGIEPRVTDISSSLNLLVSGANTLAIHGLNANAPSSDLLVSPELWAEVHDPSGTSAIGYFTKPTPGAANADRNGMLLMETVTFSQTSGTFSSPFPLTLSGNAEGQEIRYTTDGSVPTTSSALYSAPITINNTTLLRVAIFDSAGASSQTTTTHYLRLSSALANRKSNLPMVVLDAHGQTLNDSTRQSGYFQLFDRNESGVSSLASPPALTTRQGIRLRGSSSQTFPKKPYSVEFWNESNDGTDISVLGMNAEEDWVFYNPYEYDNTFNRNSIAYELSRQMGRWAPNTRFVEVFYNADGGTLDESDYSGVYVIIEQIKMNSKRLNGSVVETADVPPAGPIDPLAEGAWTGGYLIKNDRADADEYRWKTSRNNPSNENFVLYRPKLEDLDGGPYTSHSQADANSRQVAYLKAYTQAFEDALYADQASGFTTRNYLQYIDRDTWIDHLILNVFFKNVDALRLSAYFHKHANGKLQAGPLWDFDRSMDSKDGRDDAINTWNGTSDATKYFEYSWWGVLCQDPDFAQAFYDRWTVVRQSVLSDQNLSDVVLTMANEVDSTANGLGSAASRDITKWSANSPRESSYQAENQRLLTWLQNRASWMDNRTLAGGTLPSPPSVQIAHGVATISSSSGTIYYTLDGSDPRASGGAISGTVYSGTITLGTATSLKVRVRDGSGNWSTLVVEALIPEEETPATFLPSDTADWNIDANWDSSPAPYPNGIGAKAIISSPASGNRNVDLTAAVTMGQITFQQGAASDRDRIREENGTASLTFANNAGENAKLEIIGTGTGYAELEIIGGVTLSSTLTVDVANTNGNAEHGALRLRETWSGTGGITKTGLGIASFTGEGKNYSGPTRIEQGVLRVTGNASMANTASITVLDGGQLRLVSDKTPTYTFGGDITLNGLGRGSEIPDSSGQGKLGSLRYDPGSNANSYAILTNNVILASATDLHVDGGTNTLEILGSLSGSSGFVKTGGGTLALSADNASFANAIQVDNGTLLVRDNLGASITLGESGILDAAGSVGSINGTGTLVLPATALQTPSLASQHLDMLFTSTSAPDLANPSASGNPLLITDSPGTPQSLDLYLDLGETPTAGTVLQGGYLLPLNASWAPVFDIPSIRVFVVDAAGSHSFRNKTWSPLTNTVLTSVPIILTGSSGPVTGRIMEIQIGGAPLSYAAWREASFTAEEIADDSISGPAASAAGDGISNLVRFALGVAPYESAAARLPRIEVANGIVNFTFPYQPQLRGLRWTMETSTDLSTWTNASDLFDSRTVTEFPSGDDWMQVQDTPGDTGRFYRLRITEDDTL